ncbi:MAG TPA: pyridoxamine 5'-phosphate oxidase family protein [Aliicoccus persicus]|uniref:Pyridoxamine 5'-phosphate oxidase family protein n=1 Tax=Aliicoccus persicus TaxID=930138 RepID=A0A921B6A6_9STAP|nr:pyridoxamine 5'-phosphate oxidase family protein [Aliicoccus persicus]
MKRSDAIKRMTEILNESKIGVCSTSKDNIPNSRYMWFYNDGLTLYAKTNEKSTKYDELLDNPIAHILLGFNEGNNHAFVEVLGDVEITNDQKIIDWLWEDEDQTYFDHPENPHLTALKITPTKILMMNDDKEHSTVEVDLEGGE